MTRKEFEASAIRKAEKALYLPRGWWGRYNDITNGRVRVRFSTAWVVSEYGQVVSRHGSRTSAIRKASKL